ncbi:MAG: methyltransferase domain-containing protein [Nitrosomonas halophila]
MPRPIKVSLQPALHEANRLSWNAATPVHNSHKYSQANFFRDGGMTLFQEEKNPLGDVAGTRLLHLLCNAGQDTLSLARLGAVVTGVDISDGAIAFARSLSAETGISATFERADAYSWLKEAGERGEAFDIVFCSYGAFCWLSDLPLFAHLVRNVLTNNGRFICVEFHPAVLVFDSDWTPLFEYGSGAEPVTLQQGVEDYVAQSGVGLAPSGLSQGATFFSNPYPAYEFQWGLGDVISSFTASGLVIRHLEEYSYSNGCKLFDDMAGLPGGRWAMPDGRPKLPLMYGLVAGKHLP